MKGLFSLAQELRVIRNGGKNSGTILGSAHETQEVQRPWQEDFDRLRQTMQQVLLAVASLSGVELPDRAHDDPRELGAMSVQLDVKTLKDRIRDDLEAFSKASAVEMAKRAEEESRAALETIQDQVRTRVDQIASESMEALRGRIESEKVEIDLSKQAKDRVTKLIEARTDEFARWVWLLCEGTGTPIPAQLERLLKPYAEEVTDKLAIFSRERLRDLLIEQEQLSRDTIQGIQASFQNQINGIVQEARRTGEQDRDEAIGQIREAAHSQREMMSQDAAGITESLRGLGQELTALKEKHIAAFEEQFSNLGRATLQTFETKIKETADSQLRESSKMLQEFQGKAAAECESQLKEVVEGHYAASLDRIQEGTMRAAASVAAEVKTVSDQVLQELSEKVNYSASRLKEEAVQTTSRIESSFKNSLEAYRCEVAQCTEAAIEEQRQAISKSVSALHRRLEHSAQILRDEIEGDTDAAG